MNSEHRGEAGRAELAPRTYTVDQAAKLLGVSRDAVYDAVARGEIRYLRFGRAIRIPKVVIDEMVGGVQAVGA